ncbi:MAG TPA: hypothetical protein VND64_31765 [Pirellulales bacterium]|nr:hypothetical protein [Pirellulales bacterium]
MVYNHFVLVIELLARIIYVQKTAHNEMTAASSQAAKYMAMTRLTGFCLRR